MDPAVHNVPFRRCIQKNTKTLYKETISDTEDRARKENICIKTELSNVLNHQQAHSHTFRCANL